MEAENSAYRTPNGFWESICADKSRKGLTRGYIFTTTPVMVGGYQFQCPCIHSLGTVELNCPPLPLLCASHSSLRPMNVAEQQEDGGRSLTPEHLNLSDLEEDEDQDDHGGDYSARFDELMSDEDEHVGDANGVEHDEDDGDDGFFYNGVDSEPSGTYREQLRDVLGAEHDLDDVDEQEADDSMIHDVAEKERFEASMDDEARVSTARAVDSWPSILNLSQSTQPVDMLSDLSPPSSASPSGYLSPPPRVIVSGAPTPVKKAMRPFLHPSISRLRSTTPQTSRSPSVGSVGTMNSQTGLSAPASHFSALSPTSSQSNLPEVPAAGTNGAATEEREVFRWTQLRNITELVYGKHTQQKVASLLGTPSLGSPTVLAANGMICLGTDLGRILVFDFKQNLKCVCDPPGMLITSCIHYYRHIETVTCR